MLHTKKTVQHTGGKVPHEMNGWVSYFMKKKNNNNLKKKVKPYGFFAVLTNSMLYFIGRLKTEFLDIYHSI